MTKIASILALALTVACGGADNGELFDDADAGGDELGSVEQAYNAPTTFSAQFGVRTASNRDRCDLTNNAQVCSIPSFHDVKWYADPALQNSTESRIEFLMGNLDTLLTTRTFTKQSNNAPANLTILKASVGSSGTSSNNIDDYSRPDFTGTITNLDEVDLPGYPAVAGNYQTHGKCTVRLDETDILAKGTDATQDQRYLDHAIVNGVIACLGRGRIPGSSLAPLNRVMQHPMSATHANDALTRGELCQLNSVNPVANGKFSNTSSCGND